MSFDPRFPDNLSVGAVGGCGWRSSIVTTAMGREVRTGRWHRSLGSWTVGHNIRSAADRDLLIAFHRVFSGRRSAFRFKDWTDFTVGATEGYVANYPGAVGGSTVLVKLYVVVDVFAALISAVRPILKPVVDSVVFNDGAVIDYDTGLVSGGTPGGSTTWTGSFDNWVRFEEDNPELVVVGPVTAGWRGISLVEHRIDPGDMV